jgi:glycosyltransferase involved in cell wall biosynthesis
MGSLIAPRTDSRPILFVAREPDETLRTFLPVIDELRRAYACESVVLFHHTPGTWARDALKSRGVLFDEVSVPTGCLPAPLAHRPGLSAANEITQFWKARALARALIAQNRPAAVVVIQDTQLLERFLVRDANQRGLPTVVVQWAFSFPQRLYDRLRTIQYARPAATPRSVLHRLLAPLTTGMYQGTMRALGLRFDLVNSYGGGEARRFAVMGEAFRDQFTAQGVHGKEIIVTGHPTHDAVFRRAATLDAVGRAAIRSMYGLPQDRTVVLYATQPVLWRRVISRETLEANVRAMAAAVAQQRGCSLVLKLHPREDAADYAFCATLDPDVHILAQAEMPDLIAACDVFVSSSSSTVLLAMMLDRPIITVNFDEVPHFDQFEPIGGTRHVRTHADFAAALDSLLHDPAAEADLTQRRASVVRRYTRFDGQAAARIAGVIADALHRRPVSAAPGPTSTAASPLEVG